MTTYILTGGNDRATPAFGLRLAKVVKQRIFHPIHILNCWFGTPREDWERLHAQRTAWFQDCLGLSTTVTLAFPDRFASQVVTANVVCIEGGDDTLLAYYLNQFRNLQQLFEGKIIIASSAGADYLATSYWAVDWREPRYGSKLLPVNIIVHYDSPFGINDPRGPIDWVKAEAELQQWIGPQETITPLREGELVVVEA